MSVYAPTVFYIKILNGSLYFRYDQILRLNKILNSTVIAHWSLALSFPVDHFSPWGKSSCKFMSRVWKKNDFYFALKCICKLEIQWLWEINCTGREHHQNYSFKWCWLLVESNPVLPTTHAFEDLWRHQLLKFALRLAYILHLILALTVQKSVLTWEMSWDLLS